MMAAARLLQASCPEQLLAGSPSRRPFAPIDRVNPCGQRSSGLRQDRRSIGAKGRRWEGLPRVSHQKVLALHCLVLPS